MKPGPSLLCFLIACSESGAPLRAPPCGSFERGLSTLIPGPDHVGFDAELAEKARRHDRMFVAVHSRATGLNADFRMEEPAARQRLLDFAAGEATELEGVEALGVWEKSAGLYAGVGLAADAYRYGVLRDSGEACADVDAARAQLVRGMEAMAVAARIDGVPGVMARSLVRTDLPHGRFRDPLPLFDENGQPLPPEKNNGEWRLDQTGDYADWVWEDSLSRDMLVGWAMAYGAVWEVVKADDTVAIDLKARLQEDARDQARALMEVRESGYDLEIPDADGRTTLHGYLNENVIDRFYLDGAENGFHAIMALGIVGAFAYAAEDPEIDAYLAERLVTERRLAQIADGEMLVLNLGAGSNFSNYNMAFTGMYLAQRYVDHPKANRWLERANETELYRKDGAPPEREPAVLKQSFFDFTYAAGIAGAKADLPGVRPADALAVANGLETLRAYPDAPYFDDAVVNCDAEEIASGSCVLADGTVVRVLGEAGWKGTLVSRELVPMAVRPPSNYHWRSDPHQLNGGGSPRVLPAVDFRMAYWLGRWVRVDG